MFKKIIKKVFIASIFASIIAGNSYVEGTFDPPNPITSTWVVNTPYTLSSSVTNEGEILVLQTSSSTPGGQNSLTNESSILGNFTNPGDITNNGLITNSGTIESYGTILNQNIFSPGSLDGHINNHGTINSYGTINNFETITNYNNFNSRGSLNNSGELINASGSFYSSGAHHLTNSGTINNKAYFEIQGLLTNTGTIYNSGILTGTTYIAGDLVHAKESPSDPTGIFTPRTDASIPSGNYQIEGNYTENQILQIDIGHNDPGFGLIDFIDVFGDVTLNPLTSVLNVNFFDGLTPGFAPSIGDTFDIIIYEGSLTGTFSALNFPTGSFFDISYDAPLGSAHAVRLTAIAGPVSAVPEPETYLLFGSFLVLAALLKKRKAYQN